MTTVNTTNFNIDQTVRVYDEFYSFDVNVPADEYDIVYSFFLREMTTPRAAGNFTVSLFRVAEETQIKGRTARMGNPGSFSLVLIEEELEPFGVTESDLIDAFINIFTHVYVHTFF